jgi:hypothetical protein
VKRATYVMAGLTAGCLAFAAGCNRAEKPPSYTPPGIKDFPKMGEALQKSPENKIKWMQTPQEKAAYLNELSRDSSFDPTYHTGMLETCAKDPDPELSQVAKELLARIKK